MNVLQALLAAVQCQPIPPRRNRNNPSTSGGGGGASRGSRNISGLSGTPSSYAGRHSTRSGQRSATSSTAVAFASILAESDMSSDCLDTTPHLLKRKISFAESITDGSPSCVCDNYQPMSILKGPHLKCSIHSIGEEGEKDIEFLPEESNVLGGEQADGTNDYDTMTRACDSRRQPSIVRKSDLPAIYSLIEEIEEEKDVVFLPEESHIIGGEQAEGNNDAHNTIDGSASLELLSVDDTHASVKGGEKTVAENDADLFSEESGVLERENGDGIDNDIKDEETGFSSSQN